MESAAERPASDRQTSSRPCYAQSGSRLASRIYCTMLCGKQAKERNDTKTELFHFLPLRHTNRLKESVLSFRQEQVARFLRLCLSFKSNKSFFEREPQWTTMMNCLISLRNERKSSGPLTESAFGRRFLAHALKSRIKERVKWLGLSRFGRRIVERR